GLDPEPVPMGERPHGEGNVLTGSRLPLPVHGGEIASTLQVSPGILPPQPAEAGFRLLSGGGGGVGVQRETYSAPFGGRLPLNAHDIAGAGARRDQPDGEVRHAPTLQLDRRELTLEAVDDEAARAPPGIGHSPAS